MQEETLDPRWPIYLPGKRLFYARLAGATKLYPFVEADRIAVRPSRLDPVFERLHESGFTPEMWSIRQNATHGKSRVEGGTFLTSALRAM